MHGKDGTQAAHSWQPKRTRVFVSRMEHALACDLVDQLVKALGKVPKVAGSSPVRAMGGGGARHGTVRCGAVRCGAVGWCRAGHFFCAWGRAELWGSRVFVLFSLRFHAAHVREYGVNRTVKYVPLHVADPGYTFAHITQWGHST